MESNHQLETISPNWVGLVKDVHDIDKRLSLLESHHEQLVAAIDELRDEARENVKTLREVRDSVVGWKSSIGTIVVLGGAVASIVFFALDHFIGPH